MPNKSIPELIDLLDVGTQAERQQAIDTFFEHGTDAIQPMVDALENASVGQSKAIASILSQMGNMAFALLATIILENTAPVSKIQGALIALSRMDDPRVVEVLVNVIMDETSNLHDAAMISLTHYGKRTHDKRVTQILQGLLEHENGYIRAESSQYLIEQLGAESIYIFKPLLTHNAYFVRQSAVESLGNLGTESAIMSLQPALNDDDVGVRIKAKAITEQHGYDPETLS